MVNSVNTGQKSNVTGYYENNHQKSRSSSDSKIGGVIQGTVTQITDQISIQFSEKTVEVPKQQLPNAKEGDVLDFRVMGISDDGSMTLQYISDEDHNVQRPTISTNVSNESLSIRVPEETYGSSESVELSVKECERELQDIRQNMTKEDYEALSKEGFSLEQYELERFDRALERIKNQREHTQRADDAKIEELKNRSEEYEKVDLSHIDDPALRQQIAAMLQGHNLPASAHNITEVMGAVKLTTQVNFLNSDSMSYLLKNEMAPTALNIYMATFNAKQELYEETQLAEDDWEALKPQVNQILQSMNGKGLQATELEAKWLFEHDLAINEDNLLAYKELVNLKENYSIPNVMDKIIQGMEQGKQAIHVELADPRGVIVQGAIVGFSNASDTALEIVVSSNQTVNLENLTSAKASVEDIVQGIVDTEAELDHASLEKELRLIAARRQLEEIRVKMTYDAGLKLASKGIDLQTDSLEDIVTGLRDLEQEYYSKLLMEGQAEVNDTNIAQLRDTLDAQSFLAQAPSYVLGVKYEHQSVTTLADLTESAKTMLASFQQAGESYEHLMTAPRGDMGDSIQRAFANMDGLLMELGIEASEANKRAVRILSYNRMEITETSVEQIKAYDKQVTSVIDALKPSTVVELIKNQINPLDTPIEELKNYIRETMEQNGPSEEQRYSDYLVQIQKNHTLSSEQRDTYIGIYRLLNQVEKSDGKAIGYLVNSGREITLNNLLTAVRSTSGQGIDATVNDEFGLLSKMEYTTKSISDQLNASFAEATPLEAAKQSYQGQLCNALYQKVTPSFLDYVNSQESLMECTIEHMSLLHQQYMNAYPQADMSSYDNVLRQVQEAMGMTDEIRFLKKADVKVSVKNIKAANAIRKDSNSFFLKINELLDEKAVDSTKSILERSDSYDEFQRNYENNVKLLTEQLRKCFENPTLKVEDALALGGYLDDTSLLQEMSHSQYYQVPVDINGKTVGVGVSIHSTAMKKAEVSIHMDTDTFGEVQADFKIKGSELKGLVVCENHPSATLFGRVLDKMKAELPESITTVAIHVCTENTVKENFSFGKKEQNIDGAQTETLFQVATTFIKYVKTTE